MRACECRMWETVDAHCGYVFPWSVWNLLQSVQGGTARHDFHHSYVACDAILHSCIGINVLACFVQMQTQRWQLRFLFQGSHNCRMATVASTYTFVLHCTLCLPRIYRAYA
jgi:hypothetical protein